MGALIVLIAAASGPGIQPARAECRIVVCNPAFAGRTFYVCGQPVIIDRFGRKWPDKCLPGVRTRTPRRVCIGQSYETFVTEGVVLESGSTITTVVR